MTATGETGVTHVREYRCCIADGCGREYDANMPETRDRATLRLFAEHYCPECRQKGTGTGAGADSGAAVSVVVTPAPTYPQCTTLTARQSIEFRNPATGRMVRIRAGERVWIASAEHYQRSTGQAQVVRNGRNAGRGWYMVLTDIRAYFERVTEVTE